MERTSLADAEPGAAFESDVHRALLQLYDPDKLDKSPLLDVFGLRGQVAPATALRRLLLDAIEALKPEDTAPVQATVWRIYRILRHRYVEQIPQQEIAISLALSQRQLRRHEQVALHVLANHLVSFHGVALAAAHPLAVAESFPVPAATVDDWSETTSEELDWLRTPVAGESIRLADVLEPVLATLRPLLRGAPVRVETDLPADLPMVAVHVMTLRQALVSILTVAVHRARNGVIAIKASAQTARVTLSFEARPAAAKAHRLPLARDDVESLEMAQQLVIPSGASLVVATSQASAAAFTAGVSLAVAQKVAVLVIDDNADAHQLLRRFLDGSAYSFVGVSDPREALAKATAYAPGVILLDVMLPGMDGWELLGRLREHPATRHTPVIVCTILPHERLSLTLGAAAFLRKPFTRAALLAALDAQVGQPAPLPAAR
jgi:CheY-like chemotaxis protein